MIFMFHTVVITGIISLVVSPPSHSLAFIPLTSSLAWESNHRGVVSRGPPLFLHQQHPPSPLTSSPSSSHGDDRRSALRRIAIIASASSLATTTPTTSSSTAVPLANAITPQQASTSYDKYAATYNTLDGGTIATSFGIDDARKQLLKQAYGNVLEIGAGTGLNLDSYPFWGDGSSKITSLTLVDISEGMLSVAKARVEEIKQQQQQQQKLSLLLGKEYDDSNTNHQKLPSITFVKADATSELISIFGENAFDTVVDTFSMCVMGNEGARKCLREMTGVVKKGGNVLLLENTRSSNPLLGYYQDITASTAAEMGGKGCIYNQNVGEMIRQTNGLHLVTEMEFASGLFRSFVGQKV